jgi:hypothetical protein
MPHSEGTPAGECPAQGDAEPDKVAESDTLLAETSSPPRRVGADEWPLPEARGESTVEEKDPDMKKVEQLLNELPKEIVVGPADTSKDEVDAKMMDALRKHLEKQSKEEVAKTTSAPGGAKANDVPEQASIAPERRPPDDGKAARQRQAKAGIKAAMALRWMNYLSTHPPTEERKARFRAAAETC